MKKISDTDFEMVEADARFILANERTLLAWVRTAITILAGAVAFTHFNDRTFEVVSIGIIIAAMGGLTALTALNRFHDADRAIRNGKLPLVGKGPAIQVGLVVSFAIAIIVIEFLQYR